METSPLICKSKSMDWFLHDKDLRHERVTVADTLLHKPHINVPQSTQPN